MKNRARDSYFIINMVASMLASLLSYGINFFLTPYMVSTVGSEAYGFVSLANNMVNYASIITVALNSVAGRFITIKMHEGKDKEAELYFNSVFGADLILAGILLMVFVPIVWNLEHLLNIPESLTASVKLLFLFAIVNFLITVISNVFSVAAFVKNMLYLSSIGNCISAILRVALLVIFFGIFPVNIAYISIVAAICSIALTFYNITVTKKLIPSIHIKLNRFSLPCIKEMFSAGVWSSVTKLSQILSDGLDLLICNLWVGSYAMGQLSIAYTIPTIFAGLISILNSLFCPQQTYYYARKETSNVIKEIKVNMKLCGFFVSVAFAGIVVYGYEFFSLWVPGENVSMIYLLSCIAVVSVLISGVTSALHNVFLLTNNLKVNSLVWMGVSFFDAVAVIVLVQFTKLGVFAIAGVSKIVGVLVSITYVPIYASACLKASKKTFYPAIIFYVLDAIFLILGFSVLKQILPPARSVFLFICDCALIGVAGSVFNYFAYLNRSERIAMKSFLQKKGYRK